MREEKPQNGFVSMYVDILSTAMAWSADELTVRELVDYAVVFREAIDGPGAYGRCAADVLATEIGYDRVLIRLCELYGIDVDPAAFIHPHEARLCLEAHLANAGVELVEDSPGQRGRRTAR
jgi:hypothetical protein